MFSVFQIGKIFALTRQLPYEYSKKLQNYFKILETLFSKLFLCSKLKNFALARDFSVIIGKIALYIHFLLENALKSRYVKMREN